MSQLVPHKRRKPFRHTEATNSSSEIGSEKSAWDYYNEKAKIEDVELVKDWYETLSNLLIFAALFSAILTAFVIESMKLLQEDTQESTRDILLFMTMQAVNASLPNSTILPYPNNPFHLEGYVVAMNCMFFASLSLSLLAALASIIILQWVGKYDAGIMSFPTAKERALHRQFRFDGVKIWRMEDMIGALPYLLYFSLVFFFTGAIIWLRHLNIIVMAVVMSFFLSGILVYIATTALAVQFPSAPFRTPLSDYLTSFIFTNPRNRENEAVKAEQSFELRTLLGYLGSIEVVSHSYNVLFTTVRLIMEQPFSLLSRVDGVITEGRWKKIFEIVLSAYQETRDERRRAMNNIMFQSLADYAVSLFVQNTSKSQALVEDLLETLQISTDEAKQNNVVLPNLQAYSLSTMSPGILYGVIRGLPTLADPAAEAYQLLRWLSETIKIPPRKFHTASLLPYPTLKPLLTTAASAICRICHREDLISENISSIVEFAAVVTPGLENLELEYDFNDQVHIGLFLRTLFSYSCSRLSRLNDHNIVMDILEDISALLKPDIQRRFQHVAIFDLLDAFSCCSMTVQRSERPTILQAFDVNQVDPAMPSSLLRVLSLDAFLRRDPFSGDQRDKRKLISLFLYDSSLFKITKLSDRELNYSKGIADPALSLIIASNSGDTLGLDTQKFSLSTSDPLLQISASHWIARVLWDSDAEALSSEELKLLENLLSSCSTNDLQGYAVGLVSLVISSSSRIQYYPLEASDFPKSFAKFNSFLLSCQPSSFLLLVSKLEDWPVGRVGLIANHFRELMREEAMSKRVLSLMEQVWDSIMVPPTTFKDCLQGFQKVPDPSLLRSCCFLALSLLETCGGYQLLNHNLILPLLSRLHSLAGPSALSPVMDRLSHIISRQETLRMQFTFENSGSSRESSIDEWIRDLGSPRWVALEEPVYWDMWLEKVKEILADSSIEHVYHRTYLDQV